MCWTRYLFILVVVVLGTSSMLAACGQKGPLVLPDKPPAEQQQKASEESRESS